MTNKPTNKWRKRLFIAVLAASLPITAIASTQPLEDDLLGDLSGWEWEDELDNSDISNIPPVMRKSRQVYENVSRGNLDRALAGVISILGELGLLNSAEEAEIISRESVDPEGARVGEPYSNPRTPQEVYLLQRHVDVVRSTIPQRLSQIVFSPQGQQTMAQQSRVLQVVEQATASAQQRVASAHQASEQQAQTSVELANNIAATNDTAQEAKASQDVLKALAAQNADLGNQQAGNSTQLAKLGEAAAFQSVQLSASTSLLSGLNDKTQTLQVLSASQNDLLSQVDAALDEQRDYQQFKDSLEQQRAYRTTQWLYIPGLNAAGARGGRS